MKSEKITARIKTLALGFLTMLPNMPGGKELKQRLVVAPDKFSLRWSAE